MASFLQPLRNEHKDLLPHIEKLRKVADQIGETPAKLLRKEVDEMYEFLVRDLIPHAQAEDKALYPVVAKALGAPQATATMSRDHTEVSRLTQELASLRTKLTAGSVTPNEERSLRRVLYGLYTLIKVHFAKEEEIYLPILESKLSEDEARRMFEAMEAAAHQAKSHAVH